jgi:hypothetical protein
MIPLARGTVLEIGVLSRSQLRPLRSRKGNQDPCARASSSRIQEWFGLQNRNGAAQILDIEFLDLPGERIPLADESVDTVAYLAEFAKSSTYCWWGTATAPKSP